MNTTWIIISSLAGIGIGLGVSRFILQKAANTIRGAAKGEARKIIRDAKRDADTTHS